MGVMRFLLPSDISDDLAEALGRSSVGGGPDNMPWPTDATVSDGRMGVRREVDESGFLIAPWDIPGFGRFFGTTGTLIEREEPYPLPLELARGKINQIRAQAAEWEAIGTPIPAELADRIHEASVSFSRAVSQNEDACHGLAQLALERGYVAARDLVAHHTESELYRRKQRQPQLDTRFGCRLNSRTLPSVAERQRFLSACNEAGLSFAWDVVEPVEGEFHWEPFDNLLSWAEDENLPVVAGPLIDFSTRRMPDWLWLWRGDLTNVARFACDYVATVLKRYAGRVRQWQLCAASNLATVLGLGEEELLWLTARLVETARHVDPKLDLVIGVAQPWGEYMGRDDRTHSPFIFADTLIRAGLGLAALDLEIVMGITPRGSYRRDLLELSRVLDLYSLLGAPLRVMLACPSAHGPDPLADAELAVDAGSQRSSWTPTTQAEWATACGVLAIAKPYVQGVYWAHWTDAMPHQFPHCGLLDSENRAKPVLGEWERIRRAHLR
jgi:hypothetical protein